jgi:primosomal protein N' (replication factor Y)
MDFSLDKETDRLMEPLRSKLRAGIFSPHLLQLPAVQRRAVYQALLRECLSRGRRVLYLTPEISLSQDFLADIERKMGGRTALLHSRLSKAQRELQWRRIKGGEVDVVLGTRSALLSPLEEVGLIIVDEEQEEAFYQRENPAYDTRWGARLRAQQESALLVLGSAWPSVETYFRAKKRGSWLGLESRPVIRQTTILDDRTFQSVIGSKILNRVRRRLDNREAVVVFCNRRGYAAVLACSRCTYTPRCRRCDVAMSFHKKEGRLICHYCNATAIPSVSCPRCGSKIVATRGPGIEVISEELHRNFPEHRVESFDKDGAGKRSERDTILSRFQMGEVDILVGTPLLAHRADLIPVSMVVIFNPEVFLGISDFQAAQKTYQNMKRMIGFLRENRSSELIVQTSFPEHHSILQAALGEYRDFYRQELQYRQVMNYPPFSCMAEVVFQEENLRTAARRSREFISHLEKNEKSSSLEILGPALAPLSRLRGKNRVQVFIKAGSRKELDTVLRESWESSRGRRSLFIFE